MTELLTTGNAESHCDSNDFEKVWKSCSHFREVQRAKINRIFLMLSAFGKETVRKRV